MLTNEQWLEVYTATIETQKDLVWVKDTLKNNHQDIDNCFNRVNELEKSQSVQKGKVAYLAITITALFTILANGIIWIFTGSGAPK